MSINLRRTERTVKSCALAVLLSFIIPTTSHAFEFSNDTGTVTGSFDTTVSVGAAWRMEDRDPELVGITNGGSSRSVNDDDGNLNFDKNDRISAVAKVTHDFDIGYKNLGFFARATYFYDDVASNKKELGSNARDQAGSEAELLDAYLRGRFDVGERALDLRLGSQVVSWGESTFIQNGINIINSVDVTKLRIPGSELREGLIPSTMLWVSQEVTDTITVEAVALSNFDKISIDQRGTFFSTTDAVSDDGDRIFIGFGRRNDQHAPPSTFGIDPEAAGWVVRAPDRNASDSGQFGVAMRLFSPTLNNTEFGVFAIRYHSRLPLVSATRGGIAAQTPVPGCTAFDLPTLLGGGGFAAACATGGNVPATYIVEYPEDIRLYGISFNTAGPAGIALQGEYSYRPNVPLQISAPEVLLAAVGLSNQITGTGATAAGVPYNTEISGYRRVKMHQFQVTATKAFGPTFGAAQFVLLGEAGYNKFDLPSDVNFAGPAVFLPATTAGGAAAGGSIQTEGFTTETSWGYRLVARLDFDNAIGAATLSPRLAVAHDVDGVGPNFVEDNKAATLGLTYNLRQKYTADISYTSFFGGRTFSGTDPAGAPAGTTQSASFASSANSVKDRDFLAISLSYSF